MVWSESARQKAFHAGSRMRTSLLLRDHPLHSFCRKISRHPASLVTASTWALSGLPDAGATMSLCQGQDLPRCVWCAPSFCWGIIKRGNGVGRTEWKSRRRRRRLGPSKCMQLSIMLSRWYAVCFPVFEILCWTVSPSGFSFKVCGKSLLPTCN